MKFLQQLPGDNGLKLNSPISFSNYRTFYFFKLLNTRRTIIRQALGIHTQATWDIKVHIHGRAPFIFCYEQGTQSPVWMERGISLVPSNALLIQVQVPLLPCSWKQLIDDGEPRGWGNFPVSTALPLPICAIHISHSAIPGSPVLIL